MRLQNIRLASATALLLIGAFPARPQSFVTPHVFTGSPDGAGPGQLVPAGNLLYGTTQNGGTNNYGSIFSFNTNGSVYQEIYSFSGPTSNGSVPNPLLATSAAFYGTTQNGGTNYQGLIYSLNLDGTSFQQLHAFGSAADGGSPQSRLLLSGNTLYGTTYSGGAHGGGTIFQINTNGTGYTNLYSFGVTTNAGVQPLGELVLAGATLYGTTASGGTNGAGVIFAIGTNGAGYTELLAFTNVPEPMYPYGGLVFSAGMLYGAGISGGAHTNNGAIFAINTNGTGFRILHDFGGFSGNTDGSVPKARLTVSGGWLFGAASGGGANGGGTLFLLNTNGSGFAVLRSFTNGADAGWDPLGAPVRVGDSVWGTAYGGGSSTAGALFRLPLPALLSQPQSLTATNLNPATFAISAADDRPVGYQWYFNTNTLLSGQTTNTFTLASATPSNAGTYTVVVTDDSGAVTSSPAVLSVVVPGVAPALTSQPQSCTVLAGNTASFTNGATGTAPLGYQWYFNTNTAVSGATGTVLVLPAVATNQAGYYTVVVTNLYGGATSTPALLTVTVPAPVPSITQPPQNYTVTNGYNAAFTNLATGSGLLLFQWYFNTNLAIAGATNAILSLNFVTTNQAGYYSVAVNNAAGSVTSAPASLTVISTQPILFAQPEALTVTNGAPVSFAVVAAGQSPLQYQWYTNSVAATYLLAGKTNSTLAFVTASNGLAGNYLVVIANSLGKATSNPALLIVLTKPVMLLQPQNVMVTNGNPVKFTANATGAGALNFQWYFRTNTLITSATNTWLALTNAITNVAGYYAVRVTNTFGAVTSSYALLAVSNGANLLGFTLNAANGSASFALANLARSTNRLWATTNLAAGGSWQVLASNVMATNGLWFFADTNAARSNSQRFYRFSTP